MVPVSLTEFTTGTKQLMVGDFLRINDLYIAEK